ncbi:class I SAM-dependent methyltransferase, partial [Francisella tularensis subsp. holarctica]|nr:class I SAM-dependent methyltransferase [Francisella tularensis subsp. holarctica]
GGISLYGLLSRFLANGFTSKKVRLINYTINFIVNIIKKIISKNYVVVFKKDNYCRVDPLKVSELVDKPLKANVYSGGCA